MTAKLTDEQIAELNRLAEKATKGPWGGSYSHWGRLQICQVNGRTIGELSRYVGLGGEENRLNEEQHANAYFIAALRNAWPAISAALAGRRSAAGVVSEEALQIAEIYKDASPDNVLKQNRDAGTLARELIRVAESPAATLSEDAVVVSTLTASVAAHILRNRASERASSAMELEALKELDAVLKESDGRCLECFSVKYLGNYCPAHRTAPCLT